MGMTTAGSTSSSQAHLDDVITVDSSLQQPKHPFFGRAVTSSTRHALLTSAVGLLAARLPASQSHLDPIVRFTPFVGEFLSWLDRQPGESYQDKWLASGADTAGREWLAEVDCDLGSAHKRARFNRGLEAVLCCGAIRPTYGFLLTVWSKRLWSTWREEHDTELFSLIGKTAAEELDRRQEKASGILIDFARMAIHTGKTLSELTCQDLINYRCACIDVKGPGTNISWATAYYCGRAAGLFSDGPPEFQALLTAQQLSAAQMVDQHQVVSPSMRTLLAEYLAERRPNLDYTSFSQLSHRLCKLFWHDIEIHHPGIDSHHLTREQIEAWKGRVMLLEDGSTRRRPGEVFGAVRSFYLDINHWANDEPERWAQWAAPSPVTRQDVRVMPRERRRATARMHARVREFAPNLPALVRSAHQHLHFATELLSLAHETPPGNEFTLAGTSYIRRVPVAAESGPRLIASGSVIDPVFLEHEAFWTWAMVEVLRHAGIRIEELLELTHHSIRPYRKPDGAIIPLLQIAPSKTDAERLIPANPELASALARIISRVTNADGSIPLVSRRDEHERSWSDPMPFLFQFRLAGRPRTFNSGTLRDYLDHAVVRAGIGSRLAPHDFRRFIPA